MDLLSAGFQSDIRLYQTDIKRFRVDQQVLIQDVEVRHAQEVAEAVNLLSKRVFDQIAFAQKILSEGGKVNRSVYALLTKLKDMSELTDERAPEQMELQSQLVPFLESLNRQLERELREIKIRRASLVDVQETLQQEMTGPPVQGDRPAAAAAAAQDGMEAHANMSVASVGSYFEGLIVFIDEHFNPLLAELVPTRGVQQAEAANPLLSRLTIRLNQLSEEKVGYSGDVDQGEGVVVYGPEDRTPLDDELADYQIEIQNYKAELLSLQRITTYLDYGIDYLNPVIASPAESPALALLNAEKLASLQELDSLRAQYLGMLKQSKRSCREKIRAFSEKLKLVEKTFRNIRYQIDRLLQRETTLQSLSRKLRTADILGAESKVGEPLHPARVAFFGDHVPPNLEGYSSTEALKTLIAGEIF